MPLARKAMSSLIYIYCSEINCKTFKGSISRGTGIIYILNTPKNIVLKKLNKKGGWKTVIDEPFKSREFNG